MAPEGNGHGQRLATEVADWRNRSRIMLQPMAAPSILGLFGFAGATFIVASHEAGWYGTDETAQYLFPFAAAFGGLAQFMAGMWAYRARDAIATAMHGTWGAFWIGYGILWLLIATGDLTTGPVMEDALGFWFFALAVITAFGAAAALFENVALTIVLASLAAGAGLLGIGEFTGGDGWITVGGWVLVGSAIAATCTAGSMMLEGAAGRVVLPLGKYKKRANIPGQQITTPIELEHGEVGVRHGQ